MTEDVEPFRVEVEKCYDIANRLDALNPELKGAFTGTPSERIQRQLADLDISNLTENVSKYRNALKDIINVRAKNREDMLSEALKRVKVIASEALNK